MKLNLRITISQIPECILSYVMQAGNLGGLFSLEVRCLTMILKKMLGKDVKAALKFQCVKSKVGSLHFPVICF